ncbi:MAG: flippase-like domain-containing protein [candidate division Zixibacteria bacterium]|nr:flippase-like domain-containing protein [candidate division Zixibacteria bacterium]MDH3938302.1 flippase-like domain-containing protein [candidate division Zixibacteria bacterium]MDH4035293.1 flippase-like domain-containing protein [candidate division Zixibacteria bacterium]
MTLTAKKYLYFVLGLVISAVLIWALFRNIAFSDLWSALRGANYLWLIPNVALIVLTMYQRAYRWRFMVEPIGRVPFSKLLAATWIGFMANNVLPLRLGEFVRAYSLSSQHKQITKSASLATIFVERMVFDLVALLLIFGGVLYYSKIVLDESMRFGLNITIVVALVGLVLIFILARKPEQMGRAITRCLFFIPDSGTELIRSVLVKFARGLEFLRDARVTAWVGMQTLMIWLLMGISNIFVFFAFGLDLPLDASFVVLVVVSISILVPSAPGFVGVYHAGAVWSLVAYGVPKAEALSCALVLHAAQYIVVTLMGFIYLKKEHLSLKRLGEEASAGDHEPDEPKESESQPV